MDTPLRELTKEMQALVVRFGELRSAAHLRARMLRGLSGELNAAFGSGLTWKEIWSTLREYGYKGSYPQFCKTSRRLAGVPTKLTRRTDRERTENLAPCRDERAPKHGEIGNSATQNIQHQEREKPAWQRQREEVAAKLDREAEEYRRREASKAKPKLFTNQPFEPPR
jgi:hypothetical protein